MKYPGKPESAPSWYRDRGQSHIEKQFSQELDSLADAIESEHWFGDPTKHSRYRVDFLLKDARLIVELDGHDYHSTKVQLENDAIRQRYLSRAGYTVIRFTGREVNRDPKKCVDEVRQIYLERMQRSQPKYRVMYVDYRFVRQETYKAISFLNQLHPSRNFDQVPLEDFIPHAIKWLHEKSFITVFVFHSEEDEKEVSYLDGYVREYDKGEIKINTISDDFYSCELGEHMVAFSHLFDEFYLIADDPIYVFPMREVLANEGVERSDDLYLANGKLLRKGNEETSFIHEDMNMVRWQNIYYVIGHTLGLELYEM